jgi:hypothetical protein
MNVVGISLSPSMVNPGSAYRLATYRAILRDFNPNIINVPNAWDPENLIDVGGRQLEGFHAYVHTIQNYTLVELPGFQELVTFFQPQYGKQATFVNAADFEDPAFVFPPGETLMLCLFVAQAVPIGLDLRDQAARIEEFINNMIAKATINPNLRLYINFTTDQIKTNWTGAEPVKYFQAHDTEVQNGVDANNDPIFDNFPTFSFSGYDPIVGVPNDNLDLDGARQIVIHERDMAEGLASAGRTTVGASFAGLPFFNRVTPLYCIGGP